ncbi:hypothetical protein COLO4_35637 [Corchorus olitorius]|uniref:Uncharacterized protein n=1 Tax=Corchorus olitorius TaxID=93759 RepID=A0A1R3GED8_9ROSI|nr:hypothetical protein COLO4_35637 [Corchorus olitorius]
MQLNQDLLGRSLSQPSVAKKILRSHFQAPPPHQAPVLQVACKGRRGSGFNRVLKKLLKPISSIFSPHFEPSISHLILLLDSIISSLALILVYKKKMSTLRGNKSKWAVVGL